MLKLNCTPFVQWVGGKKSLLEVLKKNIPPKYDTYYECFVGGGALFFELQPKKSYISDINLPLINTYKTIRDNLEPLIEQLDKHKELHCKEYYYQARDRFNETQDAIQKSSLFIYLNKSCFNALYRVNKKGCFNVPIGTQKKLTIYKKDNLKAISELLKNTDIHHHSFNKIEIRKNCFYYIDPPYYETYSKYDSLGFDSEQHIKLSEFCEEIHKKKGFFLLSNSESPFIENLYSSFNISKVISNRSVSCKSDQRGKYKEVLIKNY